MRRIGDVRDGAGVTDTGDHRSVGMVVVAVPDSADARLFVELSSYGADLTEARQTLELAIKGAEGNLLRDEAPYLSGFAALAYCRTYFPSKVRKPLTDHVAIPENLLDAHMLIGAFRNTTIANSQSQLSTTYSIAIVEVAGMRLRDVQAVTVVQPLPGPLLVRFLDLVKTVDELLLEVIEPVRQRLMAEMRRNDLAGMVAEGKLPDIIDMSEADFNPRTKRQPYPTSDTRYWSESEPG